MVMKGKFIVFEGSDGSGKTTVINELSKKFKEKNIEFETYREPGGTKISEDIRNIILDVNNKELSAKCECLLFAAGRAQLIEERIKPSLDDGKIILCDRFVMSSLLYQGIGRDLGIDNVKKINDFATGGLKPDLTLFLDIDAKTALKRKRKNFTPDRLEEEDYKFHLKIYDGYKKLAKMYKDEIVTIDATKSIDEVVEESYKIILDYIGE